MDRRVLAPPSTAPRFTGIICRGCQQPVARIVDTKKLAFTCPACRYSWIFAPRRDTGSGGATP